MSDITRKRGDTYPIILNVTWNNQPLDITGATFVMTVDPSAHPTDDSQNLFQLTGTIVDAATGQVRFDVTEQEMDNIGSYYYDIEMRLNGLKYTITSAKIAWTQDITK